MLLPQEMVKDIFALNIWTDTVIMWWHCNKIDSIFSKIISFLPYMNGKAQSIEGFLCIQKAKMKAFRFCNWEIDV